MDLRKWFLLNQQPDMKRLGQLIDHYPCSDYRSPNVLKVFLAGLDCRFRLTDGQGQPTDALRVLVEVIGGDLCRAQDLPLQDLRAFTDYKSGKLGPDFANRWFIRNISGRLLGDGAATGGWGWAWLMFRTGTYHQGLRSKRLTETVDGKKTRRTRYVVCCPVNWELNDNVYQGVWRWRSGQPNTIWDAYGYLEQHRADHPGGSEGAHHSSPPAAGAAS